MHTILNSKTDNVVFNGAGVVDWSTANPITFTKFNVGEIYTATWNPNLGIVAANSYIIV